jgi:hypothetical protein
MLMMMMLLMMVMLMMMMVRIKIFCGRGDKTGGTKRHRTKTPDCVCIHCCPQIQQKLRTSAENLL